MTRQQPLTAVGLEAVPLPVASGQIEWRGLTARPAENHRRRS